MTGAVANHSGITVECGKRMPRAGCRIQRASSLVSRICRRVYSQYVQLVFTFRSQRVENVVHASLIVERAISVNSRLLYLRFGDKGEVIATPNVPEVHYNQERTLEVK